MVAPAAGLRNRLLASLPAEELERLSPRLREVDLLQGSVLYEWLGPTDEILFPTSAVVSMVTLMEEGQTIESVLVGSDGIAGFWTVSGVRRSPWRAVVQSGGRALAIDVEEFAEQLALNPQLHALALRFTIAAHVLTSQSVGCNRFHDLGARAARWLLMVAERTGSSEIRLTQEFLSQMLGAHRPSVTVALGGLEQAGLIARRRRGVIEIRDFDRLGDAACECYRKVRDYMDRVTDLNVSL